MDEDKVMQAVDMVTALLTLGTRVLSAAAEIHKTISAARAEGRELTQEEMRSAQVAEALAFARWHELRAKSADPMDTVIGA